MKVPEEMGEYLSYVKLTVFQSRKLEELAEHYRYNNQAVIRKLIVDKYNELFKKQEDEK